MPTLDQLKDCTSAVVIERGTASITLQCYLERISAENDTYAPLLQRTRELEADGQKIALDIARYLDSEWLANELNAPVTVLDAANPENKVEREPTETELEARSKKIEKAIKKLGDEYKKNLRAVLEGKAERIAHLTESWDITITKDGEEVSWPCDKVNILTLSETLIEQMLSGVENALTGPLPQSPRSSGS